MILLSSFHHHRDAVVETKYGTIGCRSKCPFPTVIVIVPPLAARHHLGGFKQRIQGNVDDFGGTSGKRYIFSNSWQERRSRDPQIVVTWRQSGKAKMPFDVRIGEQALPRTNRQHFNHSAHLRHTGRVLDRARNRTRSYPSPCADAERDRYGQPSHYSGHHHSPKQRIPGFKNAADRYLHPPTGTTAKLFNSEAHGRRNLLLRDIVVHFHCQ